MYYTPLIYSLDHPLLDLSDFLGLQGCPYTNDDDDDVIVVVFAIVDSRGAWEWSVVSGDGGVGTYLAFPSPFSSPLPLPPVPPPWLPSCMVRDSHWTVVDRGCARHQSKVWWWKDVAGRSCWQLWGRLTTKRVTGMHPV
jgi:hypothetical protein